VSDGTGSDGTGSDGTGSDDRREPPRWKADPNPRTADDLWLRDSFRAAASAEAPDEVGLERIWRSVAEGARGPQKRVVRRWVPVVAGFILGASSGALAAIGYYAVHRVGRRDTPSSVRDAPSSAINGRAEIAVPREPTVGAARAPARGPEDASRSPSVARLALRDGPPSKPPGVRAALRTAKLPLSSSPLGAPWERIANPIEARPKADAMKAADTPKAVAIATPSEGRLLAEALSDLRGAGDAKTALDRLDLYMRLYPKGRLAQEAELVRAEALFRSGDDDAALAQLDRLPMVDIAGARPLTLLRGELRAAHGHYRKAIADLGLVFRPEQPDEISERALYTRAACLERLGETGEARSDVETYLRVFPLGAHRSDARAFLAAPGGPRPDSNGSP